MTAGLHPSWLDVAAIVDPAKIPGDIVREIVGDAVHITIFPDRSMERITIRSPEKRLAKTTRDYLWRMFPTLATGILAPVPEPPIPPAMLLTPPTGKKS